MNSEIFVAKQREEQLKLSRRMQNNVVEDIVVRNHRRKKPQFFVDNNPFHKIQYELQQKQAIEEEKKKIERELERTLQQPRRVQGPIEIPSSITGVEVEQPMIDYAQNYRFPSLEIPNHITRRHYHAVAKLRDPNTWKYDPEPEKLFAGLPYKERYYNLINGHMRGDMIPKSSEKRTSAVPEFMLHA
eukprot:TRINITY_DN8071_c0_g1_i14.p1 TRINITY_DN8071_c0_g1~~TRINITY_DN8071_c0_g1_i14.p1  ORF type:complete len:187 (-),score=58.87 TRINITY_DN8071_c0_g1_i14:232-792(-)